MNNKGMPKKRAINGQNHEKIVWAFSELKISFKATNGEGGIKTKTCQTRCFSTALALEPGSGVGFPRLWQAKPGPRAWDLQHLGRQAAALLYVGTLGMSRGAGARRVVEAVFTKRLGISSAADDDTATHEAQHSPDPARVQGVAKAHDGGLAVGAHGEPDGGNDGTESWGDKKRAVTGHACPTPSTAGRLPFTPQTRSLSFQPTPKSSVHTTLLPVQAHRFASV